MLNYGVADHNNSMCPLIVIKYQKYTKSAQFD